MTSERQIAANRRNARNSTGPRSRGGKSRAARNSLKHGLTISIANDPRYLAAMDKFAIEIAGHIADPNIVECARGIAAAELELARVRRIRIGMIEGARVFAFAEQQSQRDPCEAASPLNAADQDLETAWRDALPHLRKVLRYERRAAVKRDAALRRLVQLRLNSRSAANAGPVEAEQVFDKQSKL